HDGGSSMVGAEPVVGHVVAFFVSFGWLSPVNNGRLLVASKAIAERHVPAEGVIARLRAKLQSLAGLSVFLVPTQDVRVGARQGKSDYQFTMWCADLAELRRVAPQAAGKVRALPCNAGVSTDQ